MPRTYPRSIKSVPSGLGSTSLSVRTCAVAGTFCAASKPHMLSENVRVLLPRRCAFFGRSIFVPSVGSITSAGVDGITGHFFCVICDKYARHPALHRAVCSVRRG
jgi:hypothetical protein